MDDGRIIELRGRGPRRMDIPAGQSPVLKMAPGSKLIVDDVQLVFHEEGPFIIVTLERWSRTVAKAIALAAHQEDAEQEAVRRTRQVRRQIARDSRN